LNYKSKKWVGESNFILKAINGNRERDGRKSIPFYLIKLSQKVLKVSEMTTLLPDSRVLFYPSSP
jgi:hypothetical protein